MKNCPYGQTKPEVRHLAAFKVHLELPKRLLKKTKFSSCNFNSTCISCLRLLRYMSLNELGSHTI